jgi:KEOPS complex subunit Pcc1
VTSKKSTSPESSQRAVLRFPHETVERARVIERSIREESGRIPGDRTSTTVTRSGTTITVTIEAVDLPALRAGTFTWCSLIETAAQTARTTDE